MDNPLQIEQIRYALSWLATNAKRQISLIGNVDDPGSDLLDELEFAQPVLTSEPWVNNVSGQDLSILLETRTALEEAQEDNEWLLSKVAVLSDPIYARLRTCARRILTSLDLTYVEPKPIETL